MKKLTDHELDKWLDEFTIEYPDEAKIEQTILQLHSFVPEKKASRFQLFRNALHDFLNSTKTFWIANLVYLALGLTIIFLIGGDPNIVLFLFAPLPVIAGLVEVFRGRDEGMIELELSMKHSISQIILSKLAVIGIFNLICNLFLIAVIQLFTEPLVLIDLLRFWAVPYFVTISLCLYLSIKFKMILAAPISVSILFVTGMAVTTTNIGYETIPVQLLWFIFLFALLTIALEIKMIKKGVYHEFNN